MTEPVATPQPTPVPTSAMELLILGLRSSVLNEPDVKAFLDRHPVTSLADADTAGRRLLEDGLLSKFQIELLRIGHPQGLTLGRYRLTDLIGKGGMGRVFLATDPQLNRSVAVKVLSAPMDRADLRGRFLRETRAAAAVTHPNVVAAYDSGEYGGSLYLVMEYVPGVSLHAKVFREGPLPVAKACRYLRQAALGLAAVHAAGLVHRDIKPGNFIVTDDDRVKLLDLGLARFVEPDHPDDGPLTLQHNLGQVLGTPQFLSPEQHASSSEADSRSDIFGLGAVLFYLLSGRFPRPSVPDSHTPLPSVLRAVTVRPDLPRELTQLLDRLLASNPDDRPQTAIEVAELLVPFAGEPAPAPAEARPRPRLRAAIGVALSLLLCVAGALAVWPTSRGENPVAGASPLAGEATLPEAPPPRPTWLPAVVDAGLLTRHTRPIGALALSPDGKTLAGVDQSGTTLLWAAGGDGVPLVVLPSESHNVRGVAFAPGGGAVLFGLGDKTVGLWDIAQKKVVREFRHTQSLRCSAISPDGSQVALGDVRGGVFLFDLAGNRGQMFQPIGSGFAAALVFHPARPELICGYHHTGHVFVWEYTAAIQRQRQLNAAGQLVPNGVGLGHGENRVLALSFTRLSLLHTTRMECERLVPVGESPGFGALAVGPTGKWCLTGGRDGWVRAWDAATGREIAGAQIDTSAKPLINALVAAPDGHSAVAGCVDGSIRLVRLRNLD